MRMKKTFLGKPFIIACAVIFFLIGTIFFIHSGLTAKNRLASTDLDMFATIEECQLLETNKEENATVICLTTNDDRYLEELTPMQFYSCSYTSDTMTFKLFAYEFATTEDAAAYFENVTGKNYPVVNFSCSSGLLTHRCIVMDHEKVYCYTCPKRFYKGVTTYVNDCFSKILFDI